MKARAAGLFLDNTWRTSWEFNKEQRDAWSFAAPNGPLDYYILYGPEPKQVLSEWAWLVGHTPLPPMWSLGFQQSRYSYYPESEVRNIAKHLRADHIPADVIWLDIDYQQDNRPFTVNRERFPHFEQMVKDLAAENFSTVAIVDLHVAKLPNAGYKPYDSGRGRRSFCEECRMARRIPAWCGRGRRCFPTSRRRARATGGARCSCDLYGGGRRGLLERHERAGDL